MALNESLEALKNMIAEAAAAAAKATKSAATVTKANINILTEQDKLKKAYAELGKLYYRDFITGEEPDDAEYLPLCDAITEITKNIDDLKTSVEEFRAAKATKEEAPAEEPADMEAELDNLNKELDNLAKDLEHLDDAETSVEAVFEVVEDTPAAEEPKDEEPKE